MTPVDVICRFGAGTTLAELASIDVNVAGQEFPAVVVAPPFAATVRFPPWAGQFAPLNPSPGASAYVGFTGVVEAPSALALAWFEVSVTGLTIDEEPISRAIKPAVEVALVAATRVMDVLREGHPWVGLSGSAPHLLDVRGYPADGGTVTFDTPPNPRPRPMVVGGVPTSRESLAAALARPHHGSPSFLLSQARYFAHFAPDKQPGIAVLLAAMACEARAKDVLTARAHPAAGDLLSVIFRHPRVFPEPAQELFGFTARAVLGTSLRETDRALFDKLVTLFQKRNALAHRAASPSAPEAADLVRAAVSAFDWLASFA